MDERIPDIDIATGESRGWYAVDPSGHLITLGRTQSIKHGFRYATHADVYQPDAFQRAVSAPPVEWVDSIVASSRDVDDSVRPDLIEPSPGDQD